MENFIAIEVHRHEGADPVSFSIGYYRQEFVSYFARLANH